MSCKTFKYKLCPNTEQRKALFDIFKFCRELYNAALEERINFYKTFGKSRSYNAQASSLPEIKDLFPMETNPIHSQILQQVLKQLDSAFQNFFRKIKEGHPNPGYPRFKNQDRFRSILFPQIKSDLLGKPIKLTSNNRLEIYGVKNPIKIEYHRPIQGIAKQCRIVKDNNEYYLCITCKDILDNFLPKTNNIIGIDLGINSFVTQDDGTKYHHPKPYKTSLEKLQYRQRKLTLKVKGSNNRNKQKKLIGKAYKKISNIRNDFQHKLANKLIKENNLIIIEDLNIKSMLEAKGFEVNKANIQDASWRKFTEKLTYKAESAGKLIIKVNPVNTSKMCSCCGKIDFKLTLRDREYKCQSCGLTIDRDLNAAKNIKALGTSAAILK